MDNVDEVREYPFDFSIVMAVYNVESFLRESVDSLIEQDFGFEHVQLIMVDDGSTDGSGAICDEYAELYPENVKVIHKENGGVASARNAGLPYVQGRYVNFLDSDDKFSKNTFRKVYKFFLQNDAFVDVVAVPRRFFEGRKGEHDLNYKFKKGTRIIDLREDYTAIQNTSSTAFFNQDIAKSISYDVRLKYSEDTLYTCYALLRKMKLGVVTGCNHYTRKRLSGFLSATQVMEHDKKFFLDTIQYLTKTMIAYCLDVFGYIPKFVQFILMYELQWKIILQDVSSDVLLQEEIERYFDDLHNVLQYIDDDVILNQKKMNIEYKVMCLKRKYGREPNLFFRGNDLLIHYDNQKLLYWSQSRCIIDFLYIEEDRLICEGCIISVLQFENIKIFVRFDGNMIQCNTVKRNDDKRSLGQSIRSVYGFKFEISLSNKNKVALEILGCIKDNFVIMNNIVLGKYTLLTSKIPSSFLYSNGQKISLRKNKIIIEPIGKKNLFKARYKYCKELWKSKKIAARKSVFARLLFHIMKNFKHKQIWLVCDRVNKADDNGQAMFEYLSLLSPKEFDIYFIINKDSSDYSFIKTKGKVVSPLSWKYKILFLLSDKIISSQADDVILQPFGNYSYYYQDLLLKQKFIFLQHGITKDDVSDWLNRYNKNISMLVTATQPEYQSFLEYDYYYDDNVIKLTGFPRYDRLYHNEKRQIVIMPTWRAYLVTGINPVTGIRNCKAGFADSQYCQMYNILLNNGRLLNAARECGYTVAFVNHPNMVSSSEFMSFSDEVQIIPSDYAYRDIFAESDLLITDYSSVAFDFAYLRKPVLYYQADVDEFFSGLHTYEKGYFDYERDGFGEVEYDVENLVDRIIEYMQNNCQLKEKYRQRIDNTFPFNDQNNCERVYNAILALDKQEN